jgi:hypothetical protein
VANLLLRVPRRRSASSFALPRSVASGIRIFSCLLFGSQGCGKTKLLHMLAGTGTSRTAAPIISEDGLKAARLVPGRGDTPDTVRPSTTLGARSASCVDCSVDATTAERHAQQCKASWEQRWLQGRMQTRASGHACVMVSGPQVLVLCEVPIAHAEELSIAAAKDPAAQERLLAHDAMLFGFDSMSADSYAQSRALMLALSDAANNVLPVALLGLKSDLGVSSNITSMVCAISHAPCRPLAVLCPAVAVSAQLAPHVLVMTAWTLHRHSGACARAIFQCETHPS